eukprot:TRINITY_DN69967_c0_g1_i1.p1 TRINITY_DN69967_c0_g1~~TRINITY_DN69967_c0_g1_i1.p1  ORF type:complete len:158 (-),score=46.82 TRINITY_DN69967_c0_g1_i1:171-644(-)
MTTSIVWMFAAFATVLSVHTPHEMAMDEELDNDLDEDHVDESTFEHAPPSAPDDDAAIESVNQRSDTPPLQASVHVDAETPVGDGTARVAEKTLKQKAEAEEAVDDEVDADPVGSKEVSHHEYDDDDSDLDIGKSELAKSESETDALEGRCGGGGDC